MSVHRKLMEARIKLQSAALKKSGHNKFAGYYYFELGDFLPEVQKIFSGLDLCGVVSYGADIAKLTITDMEDGSSLDITSPMSSAALKGCHEVQNLGAVQTYIRRYLWVTAMEIVEHDALDAVTGSEKPKANVTPIAAPKESGKSVANVAFDALTESEQLDLTTIAQDVKALMGKPSEALDFLHAQDLSVEMTVALWALFDSKERAALKKAKQDLEVAAGTAY
jgi:hypothetical protein